MNNLKARMLVRMFNKKASSPKSKNEEIIKTLFLEPGQYVADVGSGGGYFSLRFADLVGEDGKVYAIDTNQSFLDFVKKNAKDNGMNNIVTVLAKEEKFPVDSKKFDTIFVRNVYHHLPNRVEYFKNLRDSLKTGGRVVIIEYNGSGSLNFHRMFGHYIAKEIIEAEMSSAGYQLTEEYYFLSEQSFLIFSAF
ncbi:MAG: class I SAM-dependent methyltransferase [Methanosarcinaceae archaeon]|nr:class I SAM-dependent methyltransferase [Methanosarcinaceae archaeon]